MGLVYITRAKLITKMYTVRISFKFWPTKEINFLFLFFFSPCQLWQQLKLPFLSFCTPPTLSLHCGVCCNVHSSIQALCLTCVKLLENVLWAVLHGRRSSKDLFWLSMYWMSACHMERHIGFNPSSFWLSRLKTKPYGETQLRNEDHTVK